MYLQYLLALYLLTISILDYKLSLSSGRGVTKFVLTPRIMRLVQTVKKTYTSITTRVRQALTDIHKFSLKGKEKRWGNFSGWHFCHCTRKYLTAGRRLLFVAVLSADQLCPQTLPFKRIFALQIDIFKNSSLRGIVLPGISYDYVMCLSLFSFENK